MIERHIVSVGRLSGEQVGFQAACSCGWSGPERKAATDSFGHGQAALRRRANEDALYHQREERRGP